MTDVLGFLMCLAAWVVFWRWVRPNRHRSHAAWYLERIRASLAQEGDPGPKP